MCNTLQPIWQKWVPFLIILFFIPDGAKATPHFTSFMKGHHLNTHIKMNATHQKSDLPVGNQPTFIHSSNLNADLELILVSVEHPSCFQSFDGSIEVAANGGTPPFQYALNGGVLGDSPTFTDLAAGDYTISVEDATGMERNVMVTLEEAPEIVGEVVEITDNVCFAASEGIITVTASGGAAPNGDYSYSINGGPVQSSGVFAGLNNGFYVITIFDEAECSIQVSGTVSSPADLDLIIADKQDVSCPGFDDGYVEVSAFGGSGDYQFSIEGSPFTSDSEFIDLAAGTYVVKVRDQAGCTEDIIVFIDEPEVVSFDLVSTSITCFGGDDGSISITNLMGSDSLIYQLDDHALTSDTTFEGLTAGMYTVNVFDLNSGCAFSHSLDLPDPDSLGLSVTVLADVICTGDSTGQVMLQVQNGVGEITYSVDQTFNFSGLFGGFPMGTYTASATDSLGCTTAVDFTILQVSTHELEIDSIKNVACFGGEDGCIALQSVGAAGPVQYALDGLNFQDTSLFCGLSAGEYEVTAMDSLGCLIVIEGEILEPDSLEYELFQVDHIACHGDATGRVSISVRGGTAPYVLNDFFAFPPMDTIAVEELSAGTYTVEVRDANGCMLLDTAIISQNDSIQLFTALMVGDSCGMHPSGLVDLDATGGFGTYTFELDGQSNTTGLFDSLVSGTYMALVTDELNCSAGIAVDIPEFVGLTVDSFLVTDVSCHRLADGEVQFYTSNVDGMITIETMDTVYSETNLSSLAAGIYEFIIADESGCSVLISVEILEPDPLSIAILDGSNDGSTIIVEGEGGTVPYHYSIDGGDTVQDSAVFTGLENEENTFTIIDANGCTSEISFVIPGTDDLISRDFKVSPNPSEGLFRLAYQGDQKIKSLRVTDMLGRQIKRFTDIPIEVYRQGLSIDLRSYKRGTYYLQVGLEHHQVSIPIVILR